MSVEAEIRARLAALAPEQVELVDESDRHKGHAGWQPGGGTHWRLRIVSPQFAGKSTVARHRMVYASLGDLMQHPIHALAIQARVPGEQE
ncbi:MAG TPA: BolA family protein [Burkholderiales bacterium]|nr:BolA family protein [Burkholderiales bacterium]